MSQFSPELCKLESSNMVYICRMSDCMVGLRLRVMALIFPFCYPFFFLSLYYMLTLKFVLEFCQELLKLECSNLVYTSTMSFCIMGLRIEFLALILPFICPFFIQFSLFL